MRFERIKAERNWWTPKIVNKEIAIFYMRRQNSQPTTKISPNQVRKNVEEKIFKPKNRYFSQLTKAVYIEMKSSCTSAWI